MRRVTREHAAAPLAALHAPRTARPLRGTSDTSGASQSAVSHPNLDPDGTYRAPRILTPKEGPGGRDRQVHVRPRAGLSPAPHRLLPGATGGKTPTRGGGGSPAGFLPNSGNP